MTSLLIFLTSFSSSSSSPMLLLILTILITFPRLALKPTTLSQPSMWITSKSSLKWAATLDTNCRLDTVPEAARYMTYSSEVVHDPVAFSAIIERTDLRASSKGSVIEGRATQTRLKTNLKLTVLNNKKLRHC